LEEQVEHVVDERPHRSAVAVPFAPYSEKILARSPFVPNGSGMRAGQSRNRRSRVASNEMGAGQVASERHNAATPASQDQGDSQPHHPSEAIDLDRSPRLVGSAGPARAATSFAADTQALLGREGKHGNGHLLEGGGP